MARAKFVEAPQLEKVLTHIENSVNHERDRAMVLLSYKAGLRAQEIALINWSDVLGADGEIVKPGNSFEVPPRISKYKRSRTVPMHKDLYDALKALRALKRGKKGRVIYAERVDSWTPNGVAQWFRRLYIDVGLVGCASHSGRRTFITRLVREAPNYDLSIKDVQLLAGHSFLTTTATYIEPGTRSAALVGGL